MIDEEKLRGQEYLATHEEICDQALEHYEKLATNCNDWFSTVPLAIKFYRRKAKIEAAIRYLDELDKKSNLLFDKHNADLCRYFLGQPQDTWKDKDFGLEPEKEQEEK